MRLVAVGPSQSAAPDRSIDAEGGRAGPVSMRHSTTFDQGKRWSRGPQAAVHAWALVLAFASGLGGGWDMEPEKPEHFDLDITKTWPVWSSVGLRDIWPSGHAHAKLSSCEMENRRRVLQFMSKQFMIDICNSNVMKRTARFS